jgi:tRNA G37 N-methylase Trm5
VAGVRQVSAKVRCYNMDARAFLRQLAASGTRFDHVLMNLPPLGVEFLGKRQALPGTRACQKHVRMAAQSIHPSNPPPPI